MPAELNSTAPQHSKTANVDAEPPAPGDLALETYRALRQGGLTDTDIMAFAGELLSLVATDVRAHSAAE